MIGQEVEERNRIIGQNLRKYRLLKGMTQDELAEGICSVSQLSKAENGKTYVKRTILKQLAERLGVTVEKVESVDAMQEELSEMLRIAQDAKHARNYNAAFKFIRELKERCKDFGYPDLLAESVLLECDLLITHRDYYSTIDLIEQMKDLPIFENELYKIRLVYRLGMSFEQTGQMNAAIDCYKRMEDMFQKVESDTSTTYLSILYNLVRCHISLENHHAGLRYAEKAIELSQQCAKHLYLLRMRYMMAYLLSKLGRLEEANVLYLETLQEAENNSYMEDIAIISNNYGEFLFHRGEYARARNHFRRCKMTFELIGNDFYIFDTYIYLSDLEVLEGNIPIAIEYLTHVFTIVEKLGAGSYKEKARAMIRLARIRNSQGDFEEYVRLLTEGISIFEQQCMVDQAYEVAVELAESMYERDDLRAIQLYRKAVEIHKTLKGIRR